MGTLPESENVFDKEALRRREIMEKKRLQIEANEDTTRSEDIRQFLQEIRNSYPPLERTDLTQQQFYIGISQEGQRAAVAPCDMETTLPDTTEVEIEIQDGGWGWMVVFVSFFLLSLVEGTCTVYGLFYSGIRQKFDLSATSLAMLPGALTTGLYMLSSPIASLLVNSCSYRITGIIGCMLASFGLLVSSMVQKYYAFLLLFGLICAIHTQPL